MKAIALQSTATSDRPVDLRPVDESPGLSLTAQVRGCSMMLNRPVWSCLQGGVGGGMREDSPDPD